MGDDTGAIAPDKAFERYEAGKDRRYKLFFAVNGGAFAIVSLWVKLPAETAELPAHTPLFGGLMAWQVGLGMALFCAIMALDI